MNAYIERVKERKRVKREDEGRISEREDNERVRITFDTESENHTLSCL